MTKQVNTMVVTRPYQWLFVVGVIGGWVIETAAIAHQLAINYTSHGTWLFQASTWAFPALIFLASMAFAIRRYRVGLQQVFFGTLLTTVAMSVYGALEWIDTYWYLSYGKTHPLGEDASYWQTFGNQWGLMLVVFAGYVGALLLISRRRP